MDTKEELRELIKDIKKATGKGQEEISLLAGYKQKTLTQILSNGENVEAAIRRLKVTFKNSLDNPNSTYSAMTDSEQSEVTNRYAFISNFLGIPQEEFYSSIGLTKADASRITHGDTRVITDDIIDRTCNLYRLIDRDWLLRGLGKSPLDRWQSETLNKARNNTDDKPGEEIADIRNQLEHLSNIVERIDTNLIYNLQHTLMTEAVSRAHLRRSAEFEARSLKRNLPDVLREINQSAASYLQDISQRSQEQGLNVAAV